MNQSISPADTTGETLDRINGNTLKVIDRYMQEVADGKVELQNSILRSVLDILKVNQELLEEYHQSKAHASTLATLVEELPDFT
nr:hypothetical protein [uncultured Cohaesibacter sp.]